MELTRWERMQDLFQAALDKAPSERAAFLREACAADDELLAELEQLLAANDAADCVLDRPLFVPGDLSDLDELAQRMVGRRVGSYEIRRVIASGGMGVVYEALQASPQRTVALKLMRHGLRSRLAQRRFHDESRVMARLQHPGICQIFEAGIHQSDEGPIPFFAMELIQDARMLTDYAAEHRLDTRRRLELFAQVCDAVDHGHLRGVIHRDLKPANILVEPGGRAKVIDFGIARLTDADAAVTRLPTIPGHLVGTLQYMSPEQCACEPDELDNRTDVYSLGVVLYELLAETLPYEVSGTNVAQAAYTIREVAPRRPSLVSARLSGDLEVVLLKALEKDRAQRFQSVADLTADIRRYLSDEPILARRPSAIYQLRLLARRHRIAFRAVVLTIAVLLVATAVSMRAATIARRERSNAEIRAYAEQLAAADAAIERHDIADAKARLDAAEVVLIGADLDVKPGWELEYQQSRLDQSIFPASTGATRVVAIDISGDGQLLAAALGDHGWQLWNLVTDDHEARLEKIHSEPLTTNPTAGIVDIGFLHTRNLVAVSLFDEKTKAQCFEVWNITDPKHPDRIQPCKFSPSPQQGLEPAREAGHLFASWSGSLVMLWPDDAGDPRPFAGHEREVNSVSFDTKGRLMASTSIDFTVRLWDLDREAQAAVLLGHTDHTMDAAFDASGRMLITVSLDGTIRIWDVSKSTEEYEAHPESARGVELEAIRGGNLGFTCAALQPSGTILACGATDNTLRLWELDLDQRGRVWQRPAMTHGWSVTRHREIAVLRGHFRPVNDVAFTPDGRWLVSGGLDGQLLMWAVGPSPAVPVFEGHWSSVESASFHPSGRWFASGGGDHSIRIWNVESGEGVISLYDHGDALRDVVFSPNGRLLASVSRNEVIQIRQIDDSAALPVASKPWAIEEEYDGDCDRYFQQLAFSADSRRLAGCKNDGLLKVWELGPDRSSQKIFRREENTAMNAVVFLDPDGRFLAAGGGDDSSGGRLVIADMEQSSDPQVLPTHNRPITALAVRPDGKYLAAGAADGTVILFKAGVGTIEQQWADRQHTDKVTALAFHPDGRRLFSGSYDKSIRVWDIPTKSVLAVFRGHLGAVNDLALDPSDSRLLTASAGQQGLDNVIGLWETELDTGRKARLIHLRARRALARSHAEDLVTQLFNDCVSAEEVLRQLPAEGLDVEVEESAERLARFLGDEPTLLMLKCWDCVRREGRPAGEHADALRRAELAFSIVPQRFEREGLLHLARGLALHRLGRQEEAIAALADAQRFWSQSDSDSAFAPATVAARAMALHALGRPAEARECLARIAAEIDAANQPDPGVNALLNEAARVVGGEPASPPAQKSAAVQ